MTRTIRVLLLDVPAMLAEILKHALFQQTEWLIQEAPYDSTRVDADLPVPTLVVVGSRVGGSRRRALRLLALWPAARIVFITDGGRRSVWYELIPHETERVEISLQELVRAFERAVRSAHRGLEVRRVRRDKSSEAGNQGR